MSALGEVRARAVAALSGLAPAGDDWPAHDGPVDSVTPPCFVAVWSEPWLTVQTVCSFLAGLDVIVFAARIDPTPGYEELELMLEEALPALSDAGLFVAGVSVPAPLEVAGVTYQAARVHLSEPVTFGGA
jgi:hypothetical protein